MDLERLKEEVAYLKFWQGIVVVTHISLMGWLVSAADTGPAYRTVLAFVTVILLSSGGITVHRQIERRIKGIGQLSPWKSL